jgi:hypothetical protein
VGQEQADGAFTPTASHYLPGMVRYLDHLASMQDNSRATRQNHSRLNRFLLFSTPTLQVRPPALVTEYMAGGSVRAALDRRARFLASPGVRLKLALDAARG